MIKILADKPAVFNFLRRLIEFDYFAVKKAIRDELLSAGGSVGATGGKILDIPCGTGEFCRMFLLSEYTGADISEIYIDYARKKHKMNFLLKDACNTGFNDGSFDAVLMLGLLHHLQEKDVLLVLKEAGRILKNNGKLLLIEDAPVSSKFNLVGRLLQKMDMGSNIRTAQWYDERLRGSFTIDKYYPVKNGFWEYSVFLLSPRSFKT